MCSVNGMNDVSDVLTWVVCCNCARIMNMPESAEIYPSMGKYTIMNMPGYACLAET